MKEVVCIKKAITTNCLLSNNLTAVVQIKAVVFDEKKFVGN